MLNTKAPLIAVLPLPFYLVFGSTPLIALFVNLALTLIFYFFFFKLMTLSGNSKSVAFFATIIISTMPLFYGLARYFFVEFGLMTMVVIWLYLLLKTSGLKSERYLVALGVVSGLGMLMKFHFYLYTI